MEDQRDTPRSAARAFESRCEVGDRERRTARPDQRLEIEVVAVRTRPDRLHAVAVPERTPRGETRAVFLVIGPLPLGYIWTACSVRLTNPNVLQT